jgi:assimilatory nitrate reductase catalytic subunit
VPRADGTAGLEAFLLGGDTRAGAWLGTLLREELAAQHYGRALLSPGAMPPMAMASRGKPVCNCLDVSDQAIRAELSRCEGHADARLAHLQATLKCGTQCGSCVPELRRMVRLHLPTAAPAEAAQ